MTGDSSKTGLIQNEHGTATSSSSDLKCEVECRLYPGRYYVLMVLAFLSVSQNIAWMTFGPIPTESNEHFGLSDDEITILAAYGPIVYIPLAFPFMWFLQRFGLRVSVVLSTWINAVGCGIQCFVPDGRQWIFLLHIGHILIASVGPTVMSSPPQLSSVWFPPNQRTFATALTTMSQSFGIALGFIIIPYLTRQYDIHTMLYIQAEMALFVALLASIYFPPHPPTPPSLSAGTERINFKASLKALVCNRAFLLLAVSGGLVNGASMGFSSVLSIIINPTSGFNDLVTVNSIDEFFHSNAWLGALSSLAGALGGQLTGLLADRLQRRFKIILLILLMLATLLCVWFSLSIYGYTNNSAINIFITLCLVYFFSMATTPIYLEAGVEATYPVPEGSSGGVLTVLSNVATVILQVIALLHIFSNQHPERARAMVWVLTGLTALAGLLLLLFRQDYRRLNLDSQT